MKVKIAIFGLVLVILTIGGCFAVTYGGRKVAHNVVMPRVAARLGADLEWDDISPSIGHVTIENLSLSIPEIPELSTNLGHITVNYRLWPLLQGDVEISRILVESPDVRFSSITSETITKLRDHLSRINQRNSEASSGENSSQGPPSTRPELRVVNGSVVARDFAGTTLTLSGISSTLAEHGRFDLQLQSSSIIDDTEQVLGRLGRASVVGFVDSTTGVEIDEATIEGAQVRMVWGLGPDKVVETLKAYRNIVTGDPTTENDAPDDSADDESRRRIRLPSSVSLSDSQVELVWFVREGDESADDPESSERELELVDVEGQIFLGTDDSPPSVELTGRLEPGHGRFGLTATVDDEGLPSARAQVTSLRIGRLAAGLSLSGLAFDESSVLDGDVTLSRGLDGGIRFRGETSADGVTLNGRLIASSPVTDVRLRAVTRGIYRHEERTITVDETHLWLNGIETLLSGTLTRHQERTALDISTELYPVHCAALFEATPEALRNRLDGLTLDGTISGRARLAVDTENPEDLVLEVDIQNGCRATGSGVLDIERLYGAFLHHVDLPDDEPYEFRTGPGSGAWASLGGISPYMIAAVQTTEDGRFYFHNGFNLSEIRRALIRDIRARGPRFGASTISMQLARNLYLGRDRTLSRKLQEALLTWYIEDHLEKDELLALYLNIIEFGPRIFGIRHAAMHYFGRQPDDLSPREAAFLAKLLPNPVNRHEQTYDERELSPRWRSMVDRLLGVMRERRALTEVEYRAALEQRIVFHRSGEPLPPFRRWPTRPPFLGRQGGSVDADTEPERWLEIDGEAHIPAPADLLDDFEF